jgi:hypothetical protein
MNTEKKGKIIAAIISHLKFHARKQKKEFCEGDTFFALAFKTENELIQIAETIGAYKSKN